MPGKHPFEYAVIRVAPRVEREEFVNVGVILYCKRPPFLGMRYAVDENRLTALFPEIDLDEVKAHLHALEQTCLGLSAASPIAALEPGERFRWLTARRSTIIQMSAVHPGVCDAGEAALERVMREMVG